ncbi:hypothetical protein [Streptomyces cyaneofuscatus]|uniref:hypothetical protein n=1 Tax=Streptomyces cyaneofuscatus TaxID=66883 RepID=UPI0033AA09B6
MATHVPLASAAGGTTDGAADGHPPVRGAVPLYVSDYAELRVPPGGGEPTTVAATGPTRPTGMVLDASGDLCIAGTGNSGPCPWRARTPRPDRPYRSRGATPAEGFRDAY